LDKLEQHKTKSGVPSEVVRRDFASCEPEPFVKDYEKFRENFSFKHVEEQFSWHKTGKVNAAHECIDRHAGTWRKNKVALYYADDSGLKKFTFLEMKILTDKFSNVLRKLQVRKGDRVFIFLPRSPEFYASFLGTLKAGAIAGPLFEAFMAEAVRDRLADSGASVLITNAELLKRVPVKELPLLKHVIIAGDLSGRELAHNEHSYDAEMAKAPEKCDIVWVGREDGMVLHYTSGSTGKPKGALHVHNAMVGHYATGKYSLDLHEEDIYWCTADPGWVTGTSYGFLAPWLLGVSVVIRGGRFDVDKWYQTIQDRKVSVWYSAPTAFRLLMAAGDEKAAQYDFSTVRHIFSVGEPLNGEVVKWGLKVFGKAIMENWWMTETGMQLVCNFPCMPLKLSSMGKAFFGIEAAIIDGNGNKKPPYEIGDLAVRRGWPSMMRQIWNNEEKYKSYFRGQNGEWYVSGDSAYMDEEGYFFFEGRIDDVIKTSGERVGPFEVESALIEHPAVAEAGVIGKPDAVRGSIIKAFVALKPGVAQADHLKTELMDFVKTRLAAHAKPKEIEFVDRLPKTRSGKIMRRVLRAKELGLPMGDLSTMED
jgi:acetyl-CoA synthetase